VKLGQTLNGYTVVSRPTNADAGKCLWAFAEKDGSDYFIKEFLDPKIPKPDSMGSVADKERRFAECKRFAERHLRMMNLLRADHLHAGNMVLAVDFFAEGTRYYKVTPRIRPTDASPQDLQPRGQLVLLRTLADSLQLLHGHGIVHGDLKPENVLLARPGQGPLLIAKLIDFDDAYPVGDPPPRAVIGGNPLYGAPEWLRYLREDSLAKARSLTQAVDMFAFGLLIHTYLFGELPGYGTDHESPAAAVLDGVALDWDPRLPWQLRRLLGDLTAADPLARPGIDTAADALARPDVLTADVPVETPAEPPEAPAELGITGQGRVRFNFATRQPTTRLRINLTGNN
jgi:serine/threonine protein kinase